MIILAIVNGYPPEDGFLNFVSRQIESIKKINIKVFTVYCGKGSSLKDLFTSLIEVLRICRVYKPDIVHCHYGSMTGLIGLIAKFLLKQRLVITFRGSDISGTYISYKRITYLSRVSIFLSKICALFADHIIVVSRNLLDKLPHKCWSKTSIIPTGINLEIFRPIEKSEARRILCLSPDKKILLCDGHSPIKNVKFVKEVYQYLSKQRDDLELVILQDIPQRKMPLYLNAGDVLIFTSFHEGSPNIIKEAMACNLPIVSVFCGDVEERLRGVFPSQVVPPDLARLASAVDLVLRSGIKSNGRKKIEEISEDKIALRIKEVYDGIMKKK